MPVLVLVLGLAGACWSQAEETLNPLALGLRQEFNQVSAAIDTMVRLYGSERIKRVTENKPNPRANLKTVLIFWADDEAEILLNGHPVGSTRLTPKRVEIPSMYLQDRNVLRVNGWDTDRVESGFMAGLYVEGEQGQLHPILLTGDSSWYTADGVAEERFYTHAVPDIPGARVIWGETLFGQVRFQAEFSLQAMEQARREKSLADPISTAPPEPMEMHQVVSRLVALQERRNALSEQLEALGSGHHPAIYRGQVTSPLAYTLGRAAPLSESQSLAAANQVQEWTQTLPAVQQDLVWQESRRLKGAEAATQDKEIGRGARAPLERRKDYKPPPEHGPGQDGARRSAGAVGGEGRANSSVQAYMGRGSEWTWWALIAGLTLYLGGIGRQWWQVFSGKGWRL